MTHPHHHHQHQHHHHNPSSQQQQQQQATQCCKPLRLLVYGCIVTIASHLLYSPEEVAAINPVLDLNNTFPYLINKTNGQVIEPRDYMDFDSLYVPSASYKRNQTAQGHNYYMIKAFDFANYYQSDYWHYSNDEDLRRSAEPVASPTRCAQQLDWLESRINKSGSLYGRGEQHVNLMAIVDAFGRPESATYMGHGYWLGSYHECLRTTIDMEAYEREESCARSPESAACNATITRRPADLLAPRYCIGKVRESDWPSDDDYVPRISYKVGLCLPETCETLSIGKHREQIERLMRFNLPEYMRSRMQLRDMYCLPDSRSPIRKLPLSSRIYLTICALWLLALVAATAVHSCYKRHQKDIRNIIRDEQLHRDLDAALANGVIHRQVEAPFASGALSTCCSNGHETADDCCTIKCKMMTNNLGNHQNHINNNINNNNNHQEKSPAAIREMLTTGAHLLMIKTQASLGALASSTQLIQSPKAAEAASAMSSPHLAADRHEKLSVALELGDLRSADSTLTSSASSSSASDAMSSSSTLSNWLAESPLIMKILRSMSISENLRDFQKPPAMLRNPDSLKKLRVNLNALDSIKCLCCILVIFGHIIFIHMQHLSNIQHTIELSHEMAPRVLIAFFNFVDTFFIISGMLTAYFIFKRFNKTTFRNPLVWLYISFLRLLRLSPVYVLVFWFSKTVTIYLMDGPIWDYGTDANSNKGLCVHDHWWKSILYLGNWGTMQPLCILPAWSIIVDAQYSLVVPPILYLLFRFRRLGYVALLVAVVVSTANMSLMLATQTAVKTSDMAKIRLHVYPLISRFAAEFYNTAWNRIGPVAIGILGGHILYLYDSNHIRRWPWFMRGAAFKFILFLHLFIFVLPAVGRFTDSPQSPEESDMTIFVLSNATIKPIWSIINTIFVLRLVTDLRHHSILANLMSHNIWHCAGKLCFASYLIHYELILILLHSRREGLLDPTWANAGREFSATFLLSTLASYFIYILFESPVNKLITLLLMPENHRQNHDYHLKGGARDASDESKRRPEAASETLVAPESRT